MDNPGYELEQVGTRGENKHKENQERQNSRISMAQQPDQSIVPDETVAEDGEISQIIYKVDDVPSWSTCLLLGFQHFMTMMGATIALPFIIAPILCINDDHPVKCSLISTIFVVSGLVTLLQTTFGVRLPIIQGGSYAFLVPAVTMFSSEPCQSFDFQNMTQAEIDDLWMRRIAILNGAITVASVCQVIVGFTGLIGLMLAWITPLVIAPTITLVGLALMAEAADKAGRHWGISFLTMALMVIFSQYMKNVSFPLPVYRRGKGCSLAWIKVFALFPILLAIMISWIVCAILTAAGALPEKSPARTDLSVSLLKESRWFHVPYPGQWGTPIVTTAGAFGMLAGVISSMIESIGDYYACARIAGAPPPPVHAVNRAVGIEGIGCILAGLWGSGNGTTSYSENIGAIGITKVGSRRVVQCAAVFMIVFGVIEKFGALFVTIPVPVVGGIFCVMFSMITAVGLSSLQHVDLNSSRNLFVLGFSIFMGMALPKWLKSNPGAINTGLFTFDQLVTVLLQTSMFVGGLLGFILDNTIPGTKKERGIIEWQAQFSQKTSEESHDQTESSNCYDMPFGMERIRSIPQLRLLPFSPTFRGWKTRKGKKEAVGGLVIANKHAPQLPEET